MTQGKKLCVFVEKQDIKDHIAVIQFSLSFLFTLVDISGFIALGSERTGKGETYNGNICIVRVSPNNT